MFNVIAQRAPALLLSTLTLVQGPATTISARDGATVHYEEVGEGEPVILLAGGPGFTPAYMRPVCERIAKTRRCILLHQRGTGLSTSAASRPDGMTLRTFISDIEVLRQTLQLEHVTLVGHSWGGMLAMSYTTAFPDRIRALVLIASGGPTLDFMQQYNNNAQAKLTDEDRRNVSAWEAKRKSGEDPKVVDLAIMKAEMPASFHDRRKTHLLTDTLGDDAFNAPAFEAMIQDLRTTRYDLRTGLRALRLPVLIVQGSSDPIATAETLQGAIPAARLQLIDDAGHYPWLEQPDSLFGAVESFIAGAR
jgi:proline iminopeptidase